MPSRSRLHRSRVAALASGLALSLSLVAAPTAVVAQETPEEAVAAVFTAMEEWRFDEIVSLFCVDQAGAAAGLDFGGQMSDSFVGITPEQLQAAVQFSVDGPTVEILSQDETTARVRIVASMSISVNEEAAREMMVSLFASLGQEGTLDAIIDQAVQQMADSMTTETTEIDEEADLVFEDGAWKVCSPIGPASGDTDLDDDDASAVSSDAAADGDGEE